MVAANITGNVTTSQVNNLLPYVSSNIIHLDNLESIGNNGQFAFNINSPNNIIHGNATITGSLTTSNLNVVGGATIINSTTTRLNSNLVIDNRGLSGAALIIYQDQTIIDDGIIADVYDKQWSSTVPVFRVNEATTVGGSVCINTSNKDYEFNVGGSAHITNNLIVDGTSTFGSNINLTGTLYTTGSVVSISDQTIKTDLIRIPSALEKISQLTGYTYKRTDKANNEIRECGLVAQDVERVLPEVVQRNTEYNNLLTIAYGNMAGLWVEAFKEMQDRINVLEAKLATLLPQ